MKKISAALFLALSLAAASAPTFAHKAHAHGAAKLNVVIDGDDVTIALETPLINLISFERAPRNDKEREEAKSMAAVLQNAEALFLFPQDAQCRLKSVQLEASAIAAELGAAAAKKPRAAKDDHNDLDAEFSFTCQNSAALNQIEVRLFQPFPQMKRLDASLVTPKRQKATRLAPRNNRLSW